MTEHFLRLTGAAKWIWLDELKYSAYQRSNYTAFDTQGLADCNFCVVDFQKRFAFEKNIKTAHLYVSADTKFTLWCNGELVGRGPVAAGGDYGNTKPMPVYYCNYYTLNHLPTEMDFFARVQLTPSVQMDYSCGRGGFILACEVVFEDGTSETILSDETWKCRLNKSYISASALDETLDNCEWEKAAAVKSVWNLQLPDMDMLSHEYIQPVSPSTLTVEADAQAEFVLEFDKIYSGYVAFDILCGGMCEIEVQCFEILDRRPVSKETLRFDKSSSYLGLRMHSIGACRIKITNSTAARAVIKNAGLVFSHYPIHAEGSFECSDEELNKIYSVGRWTSVICRQSEHLDSPSHQEALGCTGDYFIESLINYLAFGDTRLSKMDIIRTADYLKMTDGYMFHTTYSLIWVQMLFDYYMFSGDEAIFKKTSDALSALLKRFDTYTRGGELIENPPNYMFVDWVYADEFSLHHPPKALGQTVMNAFYYKVLLLASEIYKICGNDGKAGTCAAKAERLKEEFNASFWDADKKMYISGLAAQGEAENKWLPKNPNKVYHGVHANILAVLYGLCDEKAGRHIMTEIAEKIEQTRPQPYFMHFYFEALSKVGLFEKYGLNGIMLWKPLVDICGKGMAECWEREGEAYEFDHSHAWSCTPSYQLPAKLLGFKIINSGFRRIQLCPNLHGLKWAKIKMPTPFGELEAHLSEEGGSFIKLPKEIAVELDTATELRIIHSCL